MKFLAKQFGGDGELVCIGLTPLELLAVNNALNEVCNGVHISDARLRLDSGFHGPKHAHY